jgi:hypothetical protein
MKNVGFDVVMESRGWEELMNLWSWKSRGIGEQMMIQFGNN